MAMARGSRPTALLVLLPLLQALLLLSPSAAEAATTPTPTWVLNRRIKEFNSLAAFLSNPDPDGYSSLVTALQTVPGNCGSVAGCLLDVLNTTMQAGVAVTILAPNNKAFQKLTDTSNLNLARTLLDHVLPRRLFALQLLLASKPRTYKPQFPTVGPDTIQKLRYIPLTIGITAPGLIPAAPPTSGKSTSVRRTAPKAPVTPPQVLVQAEVVAPQTWWSWLAIVHGIDTVLASSLLD